MENLKYWIWLSILNLTPSEKLYLLQKYENPKKIFLLTEEKLKKIYLPQDIIEKILDEEKRGILNEKLKMIKEKNIEVITIFDSRYPEELKNIYDFPIVLYAKGNIDLLKYKNKVSIVGCRECSIYGQEISYKLAYNLSRRDIVIVSGMAKGIDAFSHLGALNAQKYTIAVLGSGIDCVYPIQNKNLYDRILKEDSLIISEYCVGTNPQKDFFPMRNRIVSGLSKAIVVVEAKRKSGSLITADLALEQGREVFVVPGNITSKNSEGTNNLIKEGAQIVTSTDDILSILY